MAKDYSSIVVSSRARLSRCLNNLPFPSKMEKKDADKVISEVYGAISHLDEYTLSKIEDISKAQAHVLQEHHLISYDLVDSPFGAVIINADETISIMLNEEDHIREQCVLPGLNLAEAYNKLDQVDNIIVKKLDIAYNDQFGFLTSCITNVGTGLRVSVMLFLPALTLIGKMPKIISSLNSNGLTVRGAYGESTDYLGYLYQVSNERTLGQSEQEYINIITSVVTEICEREIDARKQLLYSRSNEVIDVVNRAYGVLTNCHMLPIEEFMRLAGEVKMGIALNIVRMKDSHIIDKLLESCSPYTLCSGNGSITSHEEENICRASIVSKTLLANRVK